MHARHQAEEDSVVCLAAMEDSDATGGAAAAGSGGGGSRDPHARSAGPTHRAKNGTRYAEGYRPPMNDSFF